MSSTMWWKRTTLHSLLIAGCLASHAFGAQIRYVDKDATGANDGSSWSNAFVLLQGALDVAGSGDEIRVAAGTYHPTKLVHPNAPLTATFALVDGVSMRGGYAGVGAANPDERDIVAHPTILSGAGFQWHVVTGVDLASPAVFDGFTVSDGHANDTVYGFEGGGMLLVNSNLVVRDCTFQLNSAPANGGAVAIELGGTQSFIECRFVFNNSEFAATVSIHGGGSHTFDSCTFDSNNSYGGYASISTSGDLSLVDCLLHDENAGTAIIGQGNVSLTRCNIDHCGSGQVSPGAGAISLSDGTLTLAESTFSTDVGIGGLGMISITNVVMTATNCLFLEGVAESGDPLSTTPGEGGALHAVASATTVTNCRFLGNAAFPATTLAGRGGAAYLDGGTASFVNCVFSGNTAIPVQAPSGAGGAGGAVFATGLVPQFRDCTLAGNTALGGSPAQPGVAGGIDGSCNVANSILWGNSDDSGSGEAAQLSGGAASVNFSCIEGLTGSLGGSGNIGTDPLFVDADGADNNPGTLDDDLHLGALSPCTDAGSFFLLPIDATDLDGDGNATEKLPLDLDLTVRQADDLAVADTGGGPAPVVDMGAFERSAWKNLGHALGGTNDEPLLVGLGTLQSGSLVVLSLTHALPSATAYVCLGFSAVNAPFKGGTLVPDIAAPGFVLALPIDARGNEALAGFWPLGIPAGFTFYAQDWFADPQGPQGFAASNAISGTTP